MSVDAPESVSSPKVEVTASLSQPAGSAVSTTPPSRLSVPPQLLPRRRPSAVVPPLGAATPLLPPLEGEPEEVGVEGQPVRRERRRWRPVVVVAAVMPVAAGAADMVGLWRRACPVQGKVRGES